MLWIIASGALVNFNLYALATFFPAFLTRYHKLRSAKPALGGVSAMEWRESPGVSPPAPGAIASSIGATTAACFPPPERL